MFESLYGFEPRGIENVMDVRGRSNIEDQAHDLMVNAAICKFEERLVVLIASCIILQILIMTSSFIELALVPLALLETRTAISSALGLVDLNNSRESEVKRRQYIKELIVTSWDLIFLLLICCYRLSDLYYFSIIGTPLALSLVFEYILRNPQTNKWRILNERVSHK